MKRAAWVLVAVACSSGSSDPKQLAAPSSNEFVRVSNMLEARCGSLDCHGQSGRPLRLFGQYGLRWSSDDIPGGAKVTLDEVEANYASVVGLEPEVMADVVHDGGARPNRLTLVRKALSEEAHKGGSALGADGATCLYSWLAGGPVDAKACVTASILEKPPGFEGPGGSGGTGGVPPTGGTGGTSGGGTGGGGGTLGGTGGTLTGGSGGTLTGGSGGTTANGGTGGSQTGGTGGVVCAPGDFWPCTFDETCVAKPAPTDHLAYQATECLTCHSPGGAAGPGKEFLLAGIIWEWGAQKGAYHIEVGLRDGNNFIYTCTDPNGFFWVPLAGSTAPNWLTVESRMRSWLGEKIMPDDKEHKPTCNDSKCHADPEHQLWAP